MNFDWAKLFRPLYIVLARIIMNNIEVLVENIAKELIMLFSSEEVDEVIAGIENELVKFLLMTLLAALREYLSDLSIEELIDFGFEAPQAAAIAISK